MTTQEILRAAQGAKLPLALNQHLPPDIRAVDIRSVPDGFHARYAAHAKTYRYYILNTRVDDPFTYDTCHRVGAALNLAAMQAAAAQFLLPPPGQLLRRLGQLTPEPALHRPCHHNGHQADHHFHLRRMGRQAIFHRRLPDGPVHDAADIRLQQLFQRFLAQRVQRAEADRPILIDILEQMQKAVLPGGHALLLLQKLQRFLLKGPAQQIVNVLLGADIHAHGGAVQNKQFRRGVQPLGNDDLLGHELLQRTADGLASGLGGFIPFSHLTAPFR